MKKQSYIAIILAAFLLLTGCAGGGSQTPDESKPSETAEPGTSPGAGESADPAPSTSAAEAFLSGEPGTAEIAAYLEQNAESLSPEDGDRLLERLILTQLDISQRMNWIIFDEPYITALNDTMGGVLDESKIANITDETVRKDFQEIADSLMTVVRYEETPVVEPDWEAIEAMDAYSENAAAMVMYQSRVQGRYYHGDPYNFDPAAEDIAAIEQLLGSVGSGFVRWQLKMNYDRLVSTLLFGPEGSFLYMYMEGDEQILGNIERYAEEYQGTHFGSICADLKGMQGVEIQDISDYIIDRLNFPPDDTRTMTELETEYSGAALSILKINGLKDPAIEDKIYEACLAAAQAMVQPDYTEQTVTSYSSFNNESFLCLTLVNSYTGTDGKYIYEESNLTFDLATGNILTLDDMVGQPLDAYKSALLGSMFGDALVTDISVPVEFSIYSEGITVIIPSDGDQWPAYYTVTLNGLRKFMDISKLY
jgi:hypothetical protein